MTRRYFLGMNRRGEFHGFKRLSKRTCFPSLVRARILLQPVDLILDLFRAKSLVPEEPGMIVHQYLFIGARFALTLMVGKHDAQHAPIERLCLNELAFSPQ